MSRSPTRRSLPVVPTLVLGGIGLLLLSWLGFMAHYLYRQAHRPESAAEVVLPQPPAKPGRTGR